MNKSIPNKTRYRNRKIHENKYIRGYVKNLFAQKFVGLQYLIELITQT